MRSLLLMAAALTVPALLPAQDPGHSGHDNHSGHGNHSGHEAQSQEAGSQTVCPVMGKPIDKEVYADYEGQRVYFCCKKCAAKFQDFPDRYLFAMYQKGVAPENIQKTCPISGKELGADSPSVQVLNKTIRVCCPKCQAKVKADPVKYLDILEGRKAQSECPATWEPVDGETSAVIQGQKVQFCCAGCDKKMKSDPDKYFTALARKGMVTEQAEMVCPLSGEEIKPGSGIPITWKGRRFWFCCEKCVAKFVQDPAKVLASL